MCITANVRYYTDINLQSGLRWAAACYQDFTGLIFRELVINGSKLLGYINDFGGVAAEQQARQHFNLLHATLAWLGLQEATHKACPLAQFDTRDMSVTIEVDTLSDIMSLVILILILIDNEQILTISGHY